ncbi:RING FINGER PROTEIN [Salix viminalis]|uniref:RING FINGER PROTEIN n=1 Tax=Salix viminalis TaxID=40686 RepID=A0A9Q0TL27_SALVM|nr:RING FINGER PROTEIN [Salix viminalis]
MVPAQSLSKRQQQQQQQQQQHRLCYGSYFGGGACNESFGHMSRLEGYDSCVSEACVLGSDLVVANIPMAEDESRTDSLNNEAGSSSKDVQEERDEGWLRLSIGGQTPPPPPPPTSHESKLVLDPTTRRGGLIELDLLQGSSSSVSHQARNLSTPMFHAPDFRTPPRPLMNIAASHATNFGSTASLFFQHHPAATSSTYPLHQEINWPFRPMLSNIATASSSSSPSTSSSSSLMPLGSYFSRPFQVNSGMDVAGPSSDFRVIDPPRRPHSGIWFLLQASQNQTKEPFLPQISKSYLRIKDGRMTVRLLMKYLVSKLRLDSESEVFITIITSLSLFQSMHKKK